MSTDLGRLSLAPFGVAPSDAVNEVVHVFVLCAVFAIALLPCALILAIALGPVLLGILCAVGFGLFVFTLANLLIGLGLSAWTAERAGLRVVRRARTSRPTR